MGKLLIIIVLLVTVIFTGIIISLQNKSTLIPSLVTSNMEEIKARSLSNEALIYGIKQLSKGNLSVSETEMKQEFSNFDVIDGTIDSIKYVISSEDTIRITSYVTAKIYGEEGEKTQYKSTAEVYYKDSNYFENIITSSHGLKRTGHSYIEGNIEKNVVLDFEEVFGISMADIRLIADYDYNKKNKFGNKNNTVAGITYIEGNVNVSNKLNGSGILIVDGNFKMPSWSEFEGILWVTGDLKIAAHAKVTGSIFILGNPHVTAWCRLIYDRDIVQDLLANYNISSSSIVKILSWDN